MDKLLHEIEEKLNHDWNEPWTNHDGVLIIPEKATFSVMSVSQVVEWADSTLVENKPDILVHVTFPQGADRDFEKFWSDDVWPELPVGYDPITISFKDNTRAYDDGYAVLATACTFRFSEPKEG